MGETARRFRKKVGGQGRSAGHNTKNSTHVLNRPENGALPVHDTLRARARRSAANARDSGAGILVLQCNRFVAGRGARRSTSNFETLAQGCRKC